MNEITVFKLIYEGEVILSGKQNDIASGVHDDEVWVIKMPGIKFTYKNDYISLK